MNAVLSVLAKSFTLLSQKGDRCFYVLFQIVPKYPTVSIPNVVSWMVQPTALRYIVTKLSDRRDDDALREVLQ